MLSLVMCLRVDCDITRYVTKENLLPSIWYLFTFVGFRSKLGRRNTTVRRLPQAIHAYSGAVEHAFSGGDDTPAKTADSRIEGHLPLTRILAA